MRYHRLHEKASHRTVVAESLREKKKPELEISLDLDSHLGEKNS
jgi:hypothetical protein